MKKTVPSTGKILPHACMAGPPAAIDGPPGAGAAGEHWGRAHHATGHVCAPRSTLSDQIVIMHERQRPPVYAEAPWLWPPAAAAAAAAASPAAAAAALRAQLTAAVAAGIMAVRPPAAGGVLGAEVTGLDLRLPLAADAVARAFRAALLLHRVAVVRGMVRPA